MKNLFVVLGFLAIVFVGNAQDLPTQPSEGFIFSVGSKFTIKLHQVDSLKFDYSITKFEPYQEIIDDNNRTAVFKEDKKNGTIEIYFCLSTKGKTEEEKNKNMKVILMLNNRTKHNFLYTSEIQTKEKGAFSETSNVGTYSGVKTTEIWPYMIYQIGLNNFRIDNRKIIEEEYEVEVIEVE